MKHIEKRCAIYTRKSTEERLDIEFNTLHAQREACEAYIMSQRAEGWQAIDTEYDDGGFSGGNMDRPALKNLLEDIKKGHVDIVVVYKIDRLTRSLMDFAKLVEVFDAHKVTFVSVTQSFNTTTSMGRLTLNVLLSFAQFEREVTSERLRDKIAASKKKGIWMGGIPPLGYKATDKKLVIDNGQASIVKAIFESYLKIGSMPNLKKHLDERGIKSPIRITKKGKQYGGCVYSRGALYKILTNPVYIGKVSHKGEVYDGQHRGIIDINLWDQVQKALTSKAVSGRGKTKKKGGKILQGKLYDCEGTIYTPSYTTKSGKQYHYYVSQNLLQKRDHPKRIMARLPALEIESLITKTLDTHFRDETKLAILMAMDLEAEYRTINYITKNVSAPLLIDILKHDVTCIEIDSDTVEISINLKTLYDRVAQTLNVDLPEPVVEIGKIKTIYKSHRIKDGAIVIRSKSHTNARDNIFDLPKPELKRMVQSVVWRNEYFKGTPLPELSKREGMDISYMRRLIRQSLSIA